MATAVEDMDTQIDASDVHAVSLSSLWRAVGCPAGADPQSWFEMARPLIEGGTAYFTRIEPMPAVRFSAPQTWIHRRTPGEEITCIGRTAT
jgi:hypothetical protein